MWIKLKRILLSCIRYWNVWLVAVAILAFIVAVKHVEVRLHGAGRRASSAGTDPDIDVVIDRHDDVRTARELDDTIIGRPHGETIHDRVKVDYVDQENMPRVVDEDAVDHLQNGGNGDMPAKAIADNEVRLVAGDVVAGFGQKNAITSKIIDRPRSEGESDNDVSDWNDDANDDWKKGIDPTMNVLEQKGEDSPRNAIDAQWEGLHSNIVGNVSTSDAAGSVMEEHLESKVADHDFRSDGGERGDLHDDPLALNPLVETDGRKKESDKAEKNIVGQNEVHLPESDIDSELEDHNHTGVTENVSTLNKRTERDRVDSNGVTRMKFTANAKENEEPLDNPLAFKIIDPIVADADMNSDLGEVDKEKPVAVANPGIDVLTKETPDRKIHSNISEENERRYTTLLGNGVNEIKGKSGKQMTAARTDGAKQTGQLDGRDRPVFVVIMAQWRFGSSVIGEIFNQNPDVFYLYEPLWIVEEMVRQWRIPGPYSRETYYYSTKLLRDIARCDLSDGFMDAVNLTNKWGGRYRNNAVCRETNGSCLIPHAEWFRDVCSKLKGRQVIKVIRGDIGMIKPLVVSDNINVKVIHLVRDPRGSISSRIKYLYDIDHNEMADPKHARSGRLKPLDLLSFGNRHSDSVEGMCSWIRENVQLPDQIPNWLRDRYYLLKYEDFANDPLNVTADLYRFAGLRLPETIQGWVIRNTRPATSGGGTFDVAKNSRSTALRWMSDLSEVEIEQVERICRDVMTSLGYQPYSVLQQELKHA